MHEALVAVALIMGVLWCVATSIEIQFSRKTISVSIVRCKNCRKYDLETQCCKFWPDEGYRHPDHFCAEGERWDDNR